jgi:uncharacterized membrane protein YkvA (DUF1232 family)
MFLERWKTTARQLKREIFALYMAARDRRTPWYAKALALAVVAYALSPIDLIPDFVPVLGHLDDLLLLPLGIMLVLKMIPPQVMADCRALATAHDRKLAPNRRAAIIIVLIWLLGAIWLGKFFLGHYCGNGGWDARFGY